MRLKYKAWEDELQNDAYAYIFFCFLVSKMDLILLTQMLILVRLDKIITLVLNL